MPSSHSGKVAGNIIGLHDVDPMFARIRVEAKEPFDGPIILTVGRKRHTIAPGAAGNVWVEPDTAVRRPPKPKTARSRPSA